jgi:archaellin
MLLLKKVRSLWKFAFFAFLISIDVENNQSKTFENNYTRSFFDYWYTFLEKTHFKNIKNNAWLYRIIIINESSFHFVNNSKRVSIEIKEISSRQTFQTCNSFINSHI